jgi:DNA invertase Pin-like site-specific DNA recombinase
MLPSQSNAIDYQAKVALCYIRQSQTRDENDLNSPKRQRDNIQQVCDRNGWLPEFYEDVGGHRSGTSEHQRPEWKRLKRRISDPDVAALVANDLSRLHRNLAGVSQLIEQLERHNIKLVLASSNNDIDVTTLTGQMFAQIRGLMDAFYAKDISAKSKDAIVYRKRQGKTIGGPPFGTIRNEDGYLTSIPEGAWLLPDGTFEAGNDSDNPPTEGAIWRGYPECAERILTIYAQGGIGMQKIAYQMTDEGWAFRDRAGQPRPINEDDVRRVLSNWAEYGGLVFDRKAKDRPAYEEQDIDEIPFREDRAIFPISLLKKVAKIRHKRSYRRPDHGVNRDTYPYPFGGLIYCAHCDRLVEHHKDPKLRSLLGGSKSASGKRRYRHKGGVKCGARNRSIWCTEFDTDFTQLINALTIKPSMLSLMTELAIQSAKGFQKEDGVDPEQEKQEAIALCRRRIDAAINLYRDGTISRSDYLADVERYEREIVHWESRTTETEKIGMELAMCIEALSTLKMFWNIGDDVERQALVRNLFTEVVFDLNIRRVVGFKLKPWADRFVVLRAGVYDLENGSRGEGSDGSIEAQMEGKVMDTANTPVWGTFDFRPIHRSFLLDNGRTQLYVRT